MTVTCSEDVNKILSKNQEVPNLDKRKKFLSSETFVMNKSGDFHLQLYSSSPAPKRDYHGLTITNTEVILNSWDISRGPHVYPRRQRVCLDDFSIDKWCRSEIEFLFGKHVVKYIDRIACCDNTLFCFPERVLRKIIGLLAVNDILHLKQSSKIFFEICNTNEIWKILFQKRQQRPPTESELKQSKLGLSWHHILFTRVQDKRERKKISESFKNGVDALRRHNSEVGANIRKSAKKVEVWNRPPPSADKEKHYENKIQIPTYKVEEKIKIPSHKVENSNKRAENSNKREENSNKTEENTCSRTKDSKNVKVGISSANATKKKVEIKRTDPINETRKVSSQPTVRNIQNKSTTNLTKPLGTSNKSSKKTENLKSKSVLL